MRPSSTLLVGGLMLAACEDTGPSDTSVPIEGTLSVSTSTAGGDPDPDGYLLTVDGRQSFRLNVSGTSQLQLRSGRHALRLSGIAAHCSVTPGVDLEVDVPSEGTASVAFDVTCPGGAIQIGATTTGLDLDVDGYRIVVDGTDRGLLEPNGQASLRLMPASWTVTLTGLAQNCAIEGPVSKTVTVTDAEVTPVAFAVVCTAATGVIQVSLRSSGARVPMAFGATLDDVEMMLVGRAGPYYLTDVPAGNHVVALIRGPSHCSVDPRSQPVTVTGGRLVRDTVAIEFSVACRESPGRVGTVRITAPTTSLPAPNRYEVWYDHYEYWGYGGIPELLGTIHRNDTLVVQVQASTVANGGDPYWHDFRLKNIPSRCTVQPDWFHDTIMPLDTVDIEFAVTCRPEP